MFLLEIGDLGALFKDKLEDPTLLILMNPLFSGGLTVPRHVPKYQIS